MVSKDDIEFAKERVLELLRAKKLTPTEIKKVSALTTLSPERVLHYAISRALKTGVEERYVEQMRKMQNYFERQKRPKHATKKQADIGKALREKFKQLPKKEQEAAKKKAREAMDRLKERQRKRKR